MSSKNELMAAILFINCFNELMTVTARTRNSYKNIDPAKKMSYQILNHHSCIAWSVNTVYDNKIMSKFSSKYSKLSFKSAYKWWIHVGRNKF